MARWLGQRVGVLLLLGNLIALGAVGTPPWAGTPLSHLPRPMDGGDPAPRAAGSPFATTSPPLRLNEVDAVTALEGVEFVELFDGGQGNSPVDGLTLVLYSGDEATVYAVIALDGTTDSRGYYTIGGPATGADHTIAAGLLLDGPDAIALYDAPWYQFKVNDPVKVEGLLDAVVYAPGGEPVAGLQPLLLPGQQPLDEGQHGAATAHSAQRFPNGSGQPRETAAFAIAPPTFDEPNSNVFDAAPLVVEVWPPDDATGIATPVILEVTFSEPVTLGSSPLAINCAYGGSHSYATNGGPVTYRFRPYSPIAGGDTCQVVIYNDRIHDVDIYDPPDTLPSHVMWSFTTAPDVADNVVINEVDADTPGTDTAEFIELFDGGAGGTSLKGLLLVLFNGSDDRSYHTIDLTGQVTNAAGYFVVGNAAVAGAGLQLPNGSLQNGTDAVALVAGSAAEFPNGTPVSGVFPLDAVVYGSASDEGLLPLLNAGQPIIDENGRGAAESHSNQRCPNGSGGGRNTSSFRQNTPTPRAASDCQTDAAPAVTVRLPAPGATGISVATALTITFSEPVAVNSGWLTLACARSGPHSYSLTGGPTSFTAQPIEPLAPAETCTATLKAAKIHDLDNDDPPDSPEGNLTWTFTTAAAPPGFIVINETDADTPGSDTAEFVELYDGGAGDTDLSGLVLVFFNGSTNASYAAFDLDGQQTDAAGYWLAGNAAISPDLSFANGLLQNGPDAVALYAGDATQFPPNTPVGTAGLIDATVYGDTTGTPGLLALLLAGESAAQEGARGAADQHALQRCPNGTGGQRRTASLRPGPPSPGAPSNCTVDAAPTVTGVTPANGTTGVDVAASLTVTFSEPMTTSAGWLRLRCNAVDYAIAVASTNAITYTATPVAPLPQAQTCQATITASLVRDADNDDPPDALAADYSWSFTTAVPPAEFIIINELDSDTPGSDTAEFVELYDGGAGRTDLSGLVLVFFNGKDDRSYLAVDLDGAVTSAGGYAVIGSGAPAGGVALPAAAIQNGPDAVAIYEGDAADFPNGTAITTLGLRDAIVYGTSDPTDSGLLPLLMAGEGQVDENGRAEGDRDASGRCPNAAGGLRRTAAYRQNAPTPGAPNDCREDTPPTVVSVSPADAAENVSPAARLEVTFSEAVALDNNWFTLACDASGSHTAATEGGPLTFTLVPVAPFAAGELCTATLRAAAIHDSDSDDPPDTLPLDYTWRFRIAPAVVAEGILINEVDSDTPGGDTAEFIELYDGGRGHTDLSGLVVVLWNGSSDTAYRAIDLTGHETGAGGYFVIGGRGVGAADLPLADAALQNGPDAVALYAGTAAAFPNGTPLTVAGLRDAVVYGPDDAPDSGLLALLAAGQPQVDEGGRGDAAAHALQRCPNGQGGPRRSATFRPAAPTPGAANLCLEDAAPAVSAVFPAPGAAAVALETTLVITFTEPVTLSGAWLTLTCDGDEQAVSTLPGEQRATVVPATALPPDAHCVAMVAAAGVADRDSDDPPDTMAADYVWHFTTLPAAPPLVCGFSTNSPVWIGELVSFTITDPAPIPAGMTFQWTFGDGHGSSEAQPSHRYAAPGRYTVTLSAVASTTATCQGVVVVQPRRLYVPLIGGRPASGGG